MSLWTCEMSESEIVEIFESWKIKENKVFNIINFFGRRNLERWIVQALIWAVVAN